MATKKERAIYLIKLMGTDKKCIKYLELVLKNFPSDELTEIALRIAEDRIGELRDFVAEAFTKHLDSQTIEGLIEFYESEVGRKYNDAFNSLQKAIEAKSTPWVQSVIDATTDELQKKQLKEAADKGPDWSRYIAPFSRRY
jgi:hypothetical protein